eukprot:1878358-Prymnesium_polylepis.1
MLVDHVYTCGRALHRSGRHVPARRRPRRNPAGRVRRWNLLVVPCAGQKKTSISERVERTDIVSEAMLPGARFPHEVLLPAVHEPVPAGPGAGSGVEPPGKKHKSAKSHEQDALIGKVVAKKFTDR